MLLLFVLMRVVDCAGTQGGRETRPRGPGHQVALPLQSSSVARLRARARITSGPAPLFVTLSISNEPLGPLVVRFPHKKRLPSLKRRTLHVSPLTFWSTSYSTSILPS